MTEPRDGAPTRESKEKSEPAQAKTEPQCYARRHMPVAAAYYDYARAVSHGSGIFYSSDERDAHEFGLRKVSRRTIFTARHFLETHGWFLPLDKGKRRNRNPVTGQWLSIRYKVRSHDEWAALHPNHCRFPQTENPSANIAHGPSANIAHGDADQVQNLDSPCANIASTVCKNSDSPCANIAHKSVSESLSLKAAVRKSEAEAEQTAALKDLMADLAEFLLYLRDQNGGFYPTPETLESGRLSFHESARPFGFSEDAINQVYDRAILKVLGPAPPPQTVH